MIAKKSLIAMLFIVTSSFAYFNEEDYNSQTSGWNNFNNTPVIQNRYNYYKQGVSDTLEILNDEQSNFFLDGKKVEGISNKYLVVTDINKNNLADYIFVRSVASKLSSQYSIAVADNSKNLLIIGYFDDKNSASLLVNKLKNYAIRAYIINPSAKNYIYKSPLKNIALDENLINSIQNSLTKVVVVEKTRYLSSRPPLQNAQKNQSIKSVSATTASKQKSKAKTKTKQQKEVASQVLPPVVSTKELELTWEDKLKCLENLKLDLIQKGLFNLDTKQIKFQGKIYNIGDSINYACTKKQKADFKITQISRLNKNMTITFNNLNDRKLDIFIKYPQNGFANIDELFFNPERPKIREDLILKEEPVVIPQEKPVVEQNTETQTTTAPIVVEGGLVDYGGNLPELQEKMKEEKIIEQSQNSTKAVKAVTVGSEQATCSFKLKDGIRTQLVKQVNGEYKIEAIPPFYQNKILPVEYFSSGNFMAITAIGAQSILINKEHFNKYCH
ncbi:hypothetical protein [Campylobacter sp. JMF_03 NE3]|uniref:hypothetical protein n=1 Tax=Campylobacter sp. JMF_03 NE3 TaxID=2983831 RepID=UPI0022E9D158|nr:hypothetical protein [Campylobacter sp. JMF_03 NE3]MDA3053536.1 hypothetical protein [Campylobacter sp. JMF_03 NE3]